MPKTTPPKPMPPFPTCGGEYEWNGQEFVRLNPPVAPGCEADLMAACELQGAAIEPTPPTAEG